MLSLSSQESVGNPEPGRAVVSEVERRAITVEITPGFRS
jgi:hypothetical protein